jgi:hypothetical protein
MRGRRALIVIATLLLAGCAAEHPEDGTRTVAVWTLDPSPLIAVGDRAGADSMVLATVSDARYLANGGIAIADAGANRILFYDAAGREVARGGRRGRGPGEFVGALSMIEYGKDSVAVWDPSQYRWTLVDGKTGKAATTKDSIRAPTILHAGLEVRSDIDTPPAWSLKLLTARSVLSQEIRVGHLDDRGLLWISQDAALKQWEIYADSGAPVATLTLPGNIEALHFQRGAMIGLASDSTGLEQVVVHRVAMSDLPAVDLTPATPLVVPDSVRFALMSYMRNATTLQEMNYAMKNSYTVHADSLNLPVEPRMRFKILQANNRGWRGVGWYIDTGYTCAMIVGLAVPSGWMEGAPKCGW